MGASSGKLVITDKNAAENTSPEQPTDAHPEAANQEAPTTLVNGHAEAEQTGDAAAASTTAESQPNGDVSATTPAETTTEAAPEKTPKKHKNPLIRIPLRLSKINFSFNLGHRKRSKTATTEAQDKPQDTETAEQKPADDSVIVGVADSLVQEVITTATAAHAATLEEQTEANQPSETANHVAKEVVEPSQPVPVAEVPATTITPDVQETPQQVIAEVPVIPTKEEIIVNGNHEQINNHIADSNNTTNGYVNGDSHPIPDNDAIVGKLANLELTNGHSNHMIEVPVTNGQDQ